MKIFLNLIINLKNHHFTRFAIVGCFGVATNMAVFFVSRRFAHLGVNLAVIAAFVFAVTQNYYFNHIWTFRRDVKVKPNIPDYSKYVAINLFSLAVNLLVTNFILRLASPKVPEVVAQAFGILLGFIITYAASSVLVFAKKESVLASGKNTLSAFPKGLINEAVRILRREYKLGILICLAVFAVLFVGQIMAVIGNKSILEPVTIQALSKTGAPVPSFERFMQLARAGNYTFIKPNSDRQKEWTVENVFFKKILVGLTEFDLQTLGRVWVDIGNKSFVFSADEFRKNWTPVDRSVLSGNFTGREGDTYVFFEAPPSVRYSMSRVPVYRSFFSSIINWGGDDRLILAPLKTGVSLGFLAAFLLILARVTVICFEQLGAGRSLDEADIQKNRRDYIIFSASLFSWVIVLAALNLFIYIFYKPDIAGILNAAKEHYVVYFFKFIRPKPVERTQFALSAIFSPFILLALYIWWNKAVSKSKTIIAKWYKTAALVNMFSLGSLLYLGLAIGGFYYARDSFFAGELSKYFYGVIILPAIIFLFFKKNISKQAGAALEVMAFLCFIVVFSLSVVNVANGFVPQDLDPVIYPLVQVLAGKSLLAPVTSFYGLFPFFLAPVFFFFGFSVLKFSLLMACLVVFSFFCLKASLRLVVKDKIIYLLGFLAVVFYSVLATRTAPEYYFQYWPVRFLFPCVGLWLTALYFRRENKFIYFASFVFFAVGVLWNLDVGLVVLIAWTAALFFNDLAKQGGVGKLILRTLRHGAFGLLSIGLVTGTFAFITRLASGSFPDFSLLFRYQKLFLSGYLNIGMVPPPHTWTSVVLIYSVGLLVSVRAFYRGKISYINKIIFFLSILGFGLFAYYEGQSSDVTLFRVSYPAIILMVIFADILWDRVKTFGALAYGEFLALMFIMFILFSVPFGLLRNSGTYYKFLSLAVKNITLRDSQTLQNAKFIAEHSALGEKVFILASPQQGVLYAESKTRPVLDLPSVSDIVFPKDMNVQLKFLSENKTVKVFVKQPLEAYDIFDSRIKELIPAKYKETASSSGLSLYEPK